MPVPEWDALQTLGPPARRFGNRLRRRLLWAFLAFGIGAASTFWFRETVFDFLLIPAGGALSPHDAMPVFTAPTEMFGVTVRLALRGGLAAALPVLAFGLLTLLRPLLAPQQRLFVTIMLPLTALFFLGGAAFAYFVMMPTAMRFLLSFGAGIAVPVITITEYISLVSALMFWLGIVFELPLVMFMIAKMRVVSYRRFRNLRRFVPVMAFILSAIITPTFDAVNQTMVAIPIIILYEIGLFLSWLAWPEEGDYMMIGRTISLVRRVVRRIRAGISKVRRLIISAYRWIVRLLLRAWRWLRELPSKTWRMVRRLTASLWRRLRRWRAMKLLMRFAWWIVRRIPLRVKRAVWVRLGKALGVYEEKR